MSTRLGPLKVLFAIGVLALGPPGAAQCLGGTFVFDPVADGSIYIGGTINTNYLMASGSIRAVAVFPVSAIDNKIVQATFSVNPYGLPLYGPVVQVYGFADNDDFMKYEDYNGGSFLGDWTLPPLAAGEDAYFDVTVFLQTVTSSHVGFNLRTQGTDMFSSRSHNYGHPAQLHVTTIPEPSAPLLALAMAIPFCVVRRIARRTSSIC